MGEFDGGEVAEDDAAGRGVSGYSICQMGEFRASVGVVGEVRFAVYCYVYSR